MVVESGFAYALRKIREGHPDQYIILKARVPARLRVVDRTTGETKTTCLDDARLDANVDSEIDAVFPRVVQ
eukprot:300410-Pyramimonas_sp.AAC.1